MVAVCVILTLWVLIYPFNFRGHVVTAWLSDWTIGKLNTLGNLVLFCPFGLLMTWLAMLRGHDRGVAVIAVTFLGGGVSLLGETLQVWLPNRFSSIVDLTANTAGAGFGAIVGCYASPILTARWQALVTWLEPRPVAQRTLWLLAAVVVLKTSPFDVSPETFYMRWSLWDAYNAGWPFSAVVHWYWYPASGPALDLAAGLEVTRAVLNFVLFAGVTISVGQAVRESVSRRGDRAYPVDAIILLGVGLVLSTELLQWPVRSRLMDATDAFAGTAAVCLVAGGSWVANRWRNRR